MLILNLFIVLQFLSLVFASTYTYRHTHVLTSDVAIDIRECEYTVFVFKFDTNCIRLDGSLNEVRSVSI